MPTTPLTAYETARADLTAEDRAVLADPAVSARFEAFMAEAAQEPGKGRWWGATSSGCGRVRGEAMVAHAAYTAGLARRQVELAAQRRSVAA